MDCRREAAQERSHWQSRAPLALDVGGVQVAEDSEREPQVHESDGDTLSWEADHCHAGLDESVFREAAQ